MQPVMKWSQLRKQLRELICDDLRRRVDVHRAVYRKSWESVYDRAWITMDGNEVYELSHGAYTVVWRDARQRVAREQPDAGWSATSELAEHYIEASGVKHTSFLGYSLHRYLELPIGECLRSANPVIRAFAMIDRRTGKRSLSGITFAPDEHPLVKTFYELRTAIQEPIAGAANARGEISG